MKVNRRSLEAYRGQVDAQAEKARTFVERSLDTYFTANPEATTADGRRFAIGLLEASMPNFCDAAGTLAVDFFDEICETEDIDVDSELYDTTDWDTVEGKVRYFARHLNAGDVGAFVRDVVDATHYFVKRSAYDNMVMNCDANVVRYARVPSGFETCAFCFMLASRGFAYTSELKAGGFGHGYHNHCDCVIVPGNPGRTKIDGYDPQGMYDRWQKCAETVGGRKEARREWLALPDDERNGYIERHGDVTKAFTQFEQNRILREVETRDWHWLYTGKPVSADWSRITSAEKANLKQYERETWNNLAGKHGLVFTVLPENSSAPANIDAAKGSELWELKNPKSGKHAVEDRIRDGVGKWRKLGLTSSPKLILCNSESLRPDQDVLEEAIRRCKWYGASELLFVSHDYSWVRRLHF